MKLRKLAIKDWAKGLIFFKDNTQDRNTYIVIDEKHYAFLGDSKGTFKWSLPENNPHKFLAWYTYEKYTSWGS